MDYKKIGEFISAERKAQKLTQQKFANMLYVSEKTVSKWENGNGLPDTSLLLKICEILDVSVNELLSGQRLDTNQYKDKAESNITNLLLQRKSNKQKLIFSSLCALLSVSVLVVCILIASYCNIANWLRICLIVYGFLIFIFGLVVGIVYDINIGSFQCKHCGKQFTPSAKAYIFGPHTITTRLLKCPYCGKKSFCKKRLTKDNSNNNKPI